MREQFRRRRVSFPIRGPQAEPSESSLYVNVQRDAFLVEIVRAFPRNSNPTEAALFVQGLGC